VNQFTNAEVAMFVEHEGLGYAILNYLPASEIKDPRLRKLWIEAQRILYEINDILFPYTRLEM
jgi:hypothetical protein